MLKGFAQINDLCNSLEKSTLKAKEIEWENYIRDFYIVKSCVNTLENAAVTKYLVISKLRKNFKVLNEELENGMQCNIF